MKIIEKNHQKHKFGRKLIKMDHRNFALLDETTSLLL